MILSAAMGAAKIDSRTLAALARLQLGDAEADRFAAELHMIVGYLESLRAVDVEDVPEYLSASQPDSSLRDDEAARSWSLDRALEGAPRVRNGMFEVPKFKSE